MEVHKERWRALQITLGASGYTGTGVVHSCTAPLARAGISIFYLSTFNTDFIFVLCFVSSSRSRFEAHLITFFFSCRFL